jgi:hypothetical protein
MLDVSLTITGTAAYNADLTYSLTSVTSGTEIIGFPPSCITGSGVTLTCDQLTQGLAAQAQTIGVSAIHCAAAGAGGCNCTATLIDETDSETGTYTTAAGFITTTPAGQPADPAAGYCVKGSQMDQGVPPDPSLTTSGKLTLTRQ